MTSGYDEPDVVEDPPPKQNAQHMACIYTNDNKVWYALDMMTNVTCGPYESAESAAKDWAACVT